MLYYSIELNEHRSSRRRSGDPLDCDRLPSPRMTQSVSYSTQTIESMFEDFRRIAGDDLPKPEINTLVFAQLYALRLCVRIDFIDVSYDACLPGSDYIGAFDRNDLFDLLDMIESDPSIMCIPPVGYMLLVNRVFNGYRVDLLNKYSELEDAVGQLLETLMPHEREYLIKRFGLDDGRRHTYREIARDKGISSALTRARERNIMRKLRTPQRAKLLKPFFD